MRKRVLKNRHCNFGNIIFCLILLNLIGMGCGEGNDSDPPPLPWEESPSADVPKSVIVKIKDPEGTPSEDKKLSKPYGIVVDPIDGGFVYVANTVGDRVAVINTMDYSATAIDINVKNPMAGNTQRRGIAISPDGGYVFVTNYSDHTVSVIDTATQTVIDTIDVGEDPCNIAVTPDGIRVYVANYFSNSVSVFKTEKILAADHDVTEIGVGKKPCDLAVTLDGQYVYVVNEQSGTDSGAPDTVSVIQVSDNTVIQTILVGNSPQSIAVNECNAFVTNKLDDTVSVIRMSDFTVIATIAPEDEDNEIKGIGHWPMGIAIQKSQYNEYGQYVFIANNNSHTISVIDTSTYIVDGEVELGNTIGPKDLVVSPDGNYVYITSYQNDSVVVIGHE